MTHRCSVRPALARAFWRAAVARRVLACAALLLSAAACGGVAGDYGSGPAGTTGTGVSGGSGGTNASAAAALAGRWTRIIYFTDGDAYRSSQTTFAFDGAGSFTRVVVATNLTDGIADAVTDAGSYAATATSITLNFLTPRTGSATFAYRVQPPTGSSVTTLFLDGTAYTPLSPGTAL